jgi:hypothetical protein
VPERALGVYRVVDDPFPADAALVGAVVTVDDQSITIAYQDDGNDVTVVYTIVSSDSEVL